MMKKSIFEEVHLTLNQLISLINTIKVETYTLPIEVFNNTTIGEHVRHIIELFEQLQISYESANLNYDLRKRRLELQNNPKEAIITLHAILKNVEKPNRILFMNTVYNMGEELVETNYYRELIYNIEHCIHHQAIIKIGLLSVGVKISNTNIGVAKSTLIYKQKCVQ